MSTTTPEDFSAGYVIAALDEADRTEDGRATLALDLEPGDRIWNPISTKDPWLLVTERIRATYTRYRDGGVSLYTDPMA